MNITNENEFFDSEKIVQEIVIPKKTKYVKLGSFRPKINGGRIYIYNPEKKILGRALVTTTDEVAIGEGNKGISNKRIDIVPGCAYIEAINLKNAKKKLLKGNGNYIQFYTK